VKTGVGLITFSLFQVGRFFSRATRVLNHLAAGTLMIDGLRAGVEHTWGEFGVQDADVAAGLTRSEQEMLARFASRDDDVLLIGSGAGRDLVALVADGYRVTAVEPSPRAIAACRRQLEMRGLAADIIEGFIEDVALPRRFDVIIFSGRCYSFIPESRRRIAALRKSADHLTPRGRILITYMTEPSANPMLIRFAQLSAALTGSDWRPEPGDTILPVHPTRPLFHYEHPFRPGEIESEALAAGLRTTDRADEGSANPMVVLQPAR
jgi:SAM-dependent methyltransferase